MSCFWPVEYPAPRSRTGCAKPSGKALDEIEQIDARGGIGQLLVGDSGGAEADVFGDGAGEQMRVLQHHCRSCGADLRDRNSRMSMPPMRMAPRWTS